MPDTRIQEIAQRRGRDPQEGGDNAYLATPAPAPALVAFLEGLDMSGLDLTRDKDTGRDATL